jgi:hypothetical protein
MQTYSTPTCKQSEGTDGRDVERAGGGGVCRAGGDVAVHHPPDHYLVLQQQLSHPHHVVGPHWERVGWGGGDLPQSMDNCTSNA